MRYTVIPQTILLVDDNAVSRRSTTNVLNLYGFQVVSAASGEEAMYLFREQAFDLVLMDCHMPGMDGFETTIALRRLESAGCSHVPIVALTANASKANLKRCRESGMDDFIGKPLNQYALLWLVEHHLNRQAA